MKIIIDERPRYQPNMGSPLICFETEGLLTELEADGISSSFLDSVQNCEMYENEDVKVPIEFKPFDYIGPPIRGDYPGKVKFNATVSDDKGERKQFLYTAELNRAYLGMLTELPIEFKWDMHQLQTHDLWIRATIILAGTEQQESRVLRCHNHIVSTDNSNRGISPDIHAHVLRSTRQTGDVVYCGDKNDNQRWLSVAFPVNQNYPMSNSVSHVYQFCCKHSCSSGINRRRIEVLFTLEDLTGEIYGRKAIGVRVCSCPKRDMDKDLNEFRKRRDGSPPRKRQMIVNPRPSYTAPLVPRVQNNDIFKANFDIKGKENFKLILKTAHNAMTAELYNAINESSRQEYSQCAQQIQQLLNQISNSN